MTDRSVAYYPFPDDDNESLDRVISKVPIEHREAMIWRPTEDWLLEVSERLALALIGTLADPRVRRLDPSWKPGAVLVPDEARTTVQAILSAVPSPSKWSRIEGVEFDSAGARRAFEAAI